MKNKLDFDSNGEITKKDGELLGENLILNKSKEFLDELKKEIILLNTKENLQDLQSGFTDIINISNKENANYLEGKYSLLFGNNENKYPEIKNNLIKLIEKNDFPDSELKIKHISKKDLLEFTKIFEKYSKNNNIILNIDELINNILYFKINTHFDKNFIKTLGIDYFEIVKNINYFKDNFGKDFLYQKFKKGIFLKDLLVLKKYNGITKKDLLVLKNSGVGIKELNYLYKEGNYSEEKIKLFLNKDYKDELLQKFIPNQTKFEKQKSNLIISELLEKGIPDYMVLKLQENGFFEEIKSFGYTKEYILEVLGNIKKDNEKEVEEEGFMGENYKIYHMMILHNRAKKGLNNISTKDIFDTIAKSTKYNQYFFEEVENLAELGLLKGYIKSDSTFIDNYLKEGKTSNGKNNENIDFGYVSKNIKEIKKRYLEKINIKNLSSIEKLIKNGVSIKITKKILDLFINHGYYDKGGNDILFMLENNRELEFKKLDGILDFFDKNGKIEISTENLILFYDKGYDINKLEELKNKLEKNNINLEKDFLLIFHNFIEGNLEFKDIKFALKIKEKYAKEVDINDVLKMLSINKKQNFSKENFEKYIKLLKENNLLNGLLKDFNQILGVLGNYKPKEENLKFILEIFDGKLDKIKKNNALLEPLLYKDSINKIKNFNQNQKKEFVEFFNNSNLYPVRISMFFYRGFNLDDFNKNKEKLQNYLEKNKNKNFITKTLSNLKSEELDDFVYRFTINDFDLENFNEFDEYEKILKDEKYTDIINENNKKSLIEISIENALFNLLKSGVKPETYKKILDEKLKNNSKNNSIGDLNSNLLGVLNSDLYNNKEKYEKGLNQLDLYLNNLAVNKYLINKNITDLINTPTFQEIFKYLNKNKVELKIGNKNIEINGNYQLLSKLVDFSYRNVLKSKSYTEELSDEKIKNIIKLFEKNINEKLKEDFEETIFLGSDISYGYDHNTFVLDKNIIEESSNKFTVIDNKFSFENNILNSNKLIQFIEKKLSKGEKILLYIPGHGGIGGVSIYGKNINLDKDFYTKIMNLSKKYKNLKTVIIGCHSLYKFDIISDNFLAYNELKGNIMINSLSGYSTNNFPYILNKANEFDIDGNKKGDFNGNGKVSLAEMFTYAKIYYQDSPIIEGN